MVRILGVTLLVAYALSIGVLFTDDNCWATHERTFNSSLSDTIAGNVYPMPCWSFIQGEGAQLTLLSDRTHGASSLQDGVLEMMIHRRILTSDLKGPLALNDTDRLENVRSLLLFAPADTSAALRHKLTYLLQFPLQPLFSSNLSCPAGFSAPVALSPAVHLLTLAFLNASTLLLRFAHIFQPGEDANFSVPITFDVAQMLPFVSNVTERSLSGVWAANEVQRKAWNGESIDRGMHTPVSAGATTITLVPGQIRTFYASYVTDG